MTFSKDRHEDEELKAKFGDAVRHRRRELDISQDELAVRSGLNRSYITEVETGKRNVALVNIGRLARAMEVPIAELFSDYGADYPSSDPSRAITTEET